MKYLSTDLRQVFIKSIFAFVFLLPFSGNLFGKHIIGGDLTYVCLGIDEINNTVTFQFTMNMFRDRFSPVGDPPSPYDPWAKFGIYRQAAGNWRFESIDSTELIGPEKVEFNDDCIDLPDELEDNIDRAVYRFTLILPIRNEPYMIVYQRCCRNATISNIVNPGDTGSAIAVEISPEAQRICNNSPSFDDFPPIAICEGISKPINNGATDIDGHQLLYEFVAPLSAGGPDVRNLGNCDSAVPAPQRCLPPFSEINFILPTYSSAQPVPGDPPLTINTNTGIITGTPNRIGQYVLGIKVTEIDSNGVVIGSIQRDLQYNVTPCNFNVFPAVNSNQITNELSDKTYNIQSCGNTTIDFLNESTDVSFIESYKWIFDVNGNIFTSTEKDVSVSFPGTGTYEGQMILNEGLICSDTANITVNLYGSMEASFDSEYDTCDISDVFFKESTITDNEQVRSWFWDFGDGTTSTERNPRHFYAEPGTYEVSLTASDNEGCTDTKIAQLAYKPVPENIVIQPSTFLGCEPATIQFNNLTELIDETYDIEWDFGDGGISDTISPMHEYTEPGIYTVSVNITSELGCTVSEDFTNFITVENGPEAGFDYFPKNPSSARNTLEFLDESIDAISWQWDFGGQGFAREPNPTFTFRDTGVQVVTLIVTHPSGCADTVAQEIDVIPIADFVLPNAFSPNGDGKNDIFRGQGSLDGTSGFNMTIWDRWGGEVFYSEDSREGWNGQQGNSGPTLPQGVYVYVVRYNDPRNRPRLLKGYVTIVN